MYAVKLIKDFLIIWNFRQWWVNLHDVQNHFSVLKEGLIHSKSHSSGEKCILDMLVWVFYFTYFHLSCLFLICSLFKSFLIHKELDIVSSFEDNFNRNMNTIACYWIRNYFIVTEFFPLSITKKSLFDIIYKLFVNTVLF